MTTRAFTALGNARGCDQGHNAPLVVDPPKEIESTIAALARCHNIIDAVFAVRALNRRHFSALIKHVRSRPAMFNSLAAAAAINYAENPDEDFLFARFAHVTDNLRGFAMSSFE